MRVLILAHRFGPYGTGGVERWTEQLSSELAELGETVFVMARDDRDPPEGHPFSVVEEARGPRRVFWLRHRHADALTFRDTWADPRMEEAVAQVAAWVRPDVLHLAHPDGFGIAPLRVARRLGVPLVVTLHDPKWLCARGQLVQPDGTVCEEAEEEACVRCVGSALGRGPVRGWLDRSPLGPTLRGMKGGGLGGDPGSLARRRWRARQAGLRTVLDGADLLLSPSADLARRVAQHGVLRPIQVLPNPSPEGDRRELPAWPLRVGWFGVPHPTKGLELLVEACARAGVQLVVHGPLSHTQADAARARGATVRGAYDAEAVGELMAAVHVVALPSLWPENQPLVALEARAAGRPLLVSDLGGLPELVRDGVDGWVAPARDVEAWTRRLRTLDEEQVRAAAAASRPGWSPREHALAHAELVRGLLRGALPAIDPESLGASQ